MCTRSISTQAKKSAKQQAMVVRALVHWEFMSFGSDEAVKCQYGQRSMEEVADPFVFGGGMDVC